jgi:putative exosortase-associated protein (TIGR04073 family)
MHMKKLLLALVTVTLAGSAFADIQDPPMNDQGPTSKLGRGLSNILFGIGELPDTMIKINERQGNAAAFSTGIVKGTGRSIVRIGAGIYDFLTFPFPTHRGSFRQPMKSNIPWIHGGYTEYVPEMGWESRKNYSSTPSGF